VVKRALLGRPIATARLAHERLGRPTALAVFSSDNMSSVAYATEEILRVLIPAVGLAAFTLVLPVSGAIVLVEAILIFSYRQTIKAYPSAGGAYIVTKDNLGLLPAQVAGVALLVDYVLTVAVSTAAGVQAISSVIPLSVPVRIGLSVAFVWLIAYANLLGVRESGKIFAFPTYVFIVSLGVTVIVGLVRVALGQVTPFDPALEAQQGGLTIGTGAVALFVVLRAFASGGAAVTGVEAISNGVPAFRRPEWRNAQITLMWMGAILGTSFLAVSYLAHRLQVVPVADESKSVLAIIAQAVYGQGAVGRALFLVLQIGTTLILILAANTSFADFPRLASFHAGDSFMPRQLTKRGHKLVFSNGVIALAAAATLVIFVFRASVTAMIPLYALGVFTSFTLSQSGMARRHLRLREPGWRLGLFVNGLGAVSTAVVAIVIAVVKFAGGAWIVMLFVPILVFVLVRVNRTYEAEEHDLLGGLDPRVPPPPVGRQVVVVVVDDADARTLRTLRYALTMRPDALHAVHLGDEASSRELSDRWAAATGGLHPLELVHVGLAGPGRALAQVVRSFVVDETQVTVLVPDATRRGRLERHRERRAQSRLLGPLLALDGVSVGVISDIGGAGPTTPTAGRVRILPRTRHVAVIPVSRLDRSVVRAVRAALAMRAMDIRAVHAAVDVEAAMHLAEDWGEAGPALGIPLDIEECWDRDIPRVIRAYVAELGGDDVEISVVLPQRTYPTVLQHLLHDRTGRAIARAVALDGHANVIFVRYPVRQGVRSGAGATAPPDVTLAAPKPAPPPVASGDGGALEPHGRLPVPAVHR
jgi:amino acid transporter